MSATDLQTPITDGAIRSINFFNGRLLSARDLTLEQSANREADRRLGKAIGDGIAHGLEATKPVNFKKESPTVSVDAGLAINRLGQTLMLKARTDVALVRTSTNLGASAGFSECLPLQTGAYVAGAGVYLLTIAPAQTSEGRAVTSAVNPATTTCNTDTVVSAVQFRLIQIDSKFSQQELQATNRLRNFIAYKCFGVADISPFIADPFGSDIKKWGLLDDLRPNQLTDCEVPLAVLFWTDDDGINFIDMWSVRRRITKPRTASAWITLNSDRRCAEAEAMFLQFQDQLQDLRTQQPSLATIDAKTYFNFLPSIGFVPIGTAPKPAFDYKVFFQNKIHRDPVFIEGAQIDSLMKEALAYPPVDLNSGEMVWLYLIRENVQLFDLGGAKRPQTYVIFVNGHTPYRGNARYDLNRFSFSNFGEI
jgi:hypothetical protein